MKKSNLDKWFETRQFIRDNVIADIQDLIDETTSYIDEHKGMNTETRAECEEFIEAYSRLLDIIKSDQSMIKSYENSDCGTVSVTEID